MYPRKCFAFDRLESWQCHKFQSTRPILHLQHLHKGHQHVRSQYCYNNNIITETSRYLILKKLTMLVFHFTYSVELLTCSKIIKSSKFCWPFCWYKITWTFTQRRHRANRHVSLNITATYIIFNKTLQWSINC